MLEHLREVEDKINNSDSTEELARLERIEENLFNFE